MPSISKKIRLARKKAGLSQQDIANKTKIPIDQIQFIEEGKIDRIEGRFYQKAALTKIAKLLSLDATDIVSAFENKTTSDISNVELEIQRLKQQDSIVIPKETKEEEEIIEEIPQKNEKKSVINKVEKKKRVDIITIILSMISLFIISLLIYTIYSLLTTSNHSNSNKIKEISTQQVVSQEKISQAAQPSIEDQIAQQMKDAQEKLGLTYSGTDEDGQLVYTMQNKENYQIAVHANEKAEILDIRDDNGQLYYSDSIDKDQDVIVDIDNSTSYIIIYAKNANHLAIKMNDVILPVAKEQLSQEYRIYRIDINYNQE